MRAALRTILAVVASAGLPACANQPALPTAPTTAVAPAAPTIFIKGTVSDTAFRSLANAQVVVMNGPQAGLVTTSDIRGEFLMTGAFDDNTRFEASKAGYTVGISKLEPFCERCNPQRWVHFALDVPAAPVVVAGTYDVTFAVDPTCPGLAPELRERKFTATIPAGSRGYFPVQLSGGTFDHANLGGGVSGNYVSFYMEGTAERLSPNSFLIFSYIASATTESSPRVINAAGAGLVYYCELLSTEGVVEECYRSVTNIFNACQRDNHRMIFTRK